MEVYKNKLGAYLSLYGKSLMSWKSGQLFDIIETKEGDLLLKKK